MRKRENDIQTDKQRNRETSKKDKDRYKNTHTLQITTKQKNRKTSKKVEAHTQPKTQGRGE